MNGAESLLSYLDAPIVVGDPEGRAVYVNPAFAQRFPRAGAQALGLPLAELFDGGAREAVLRGVRSACDQCETARFRLRAGDVSYSAVASPIRTSGQAVGVVILFKEEVGAVERLLQLQREMQGALDELSGTLDTLVEQTGGRRNPQHRALVEDGVRAVTRLRKWSEEMQGVLAGRPVTAAVDRIVVADLLRRLGERAGRLGAADGVAITMLLPGSLPELHGDEARIASALQRMVEARLAATPKPDRLTIGARLVGKTKDRALLVSFAELRGGGFPAPLADSAVVLEELGEIGATRHGVASERLGRCTVVRFPLEA